MPSCPICRQPTGHKMDCQNESYVAELEAELAESNRLLRLARCPDDRCENGAIPTQEAVGGCSWHGCQWCEEVSQLDLPEGGK